MYRNLWYWQNIWPIWMVKTSGMRDFRTANNWAEHCPVETTLAKTLNGIMFFFSKDAFSVIVLFLTDLIDWRLERKYFRSTENRTAEQFDIHRFGLLKKNVVCAKLNQMPTSTYSIIKKRLNVGWGKIPTILKRFTSGHVLDRVF